MFFLIYQNLEESCKCLQFFFFRRIFRQYAQKLPIPLQIVIQKFLHLYLIHENLLVHHAQNYENSKFCYIEFRHYKILLHLLQYEIFLLHENYMYLNHHN